MNIKFKKNEKTYIISVDYRHHTILSCYANNILTYKIDLSSSLVKTILCDNYAIITVFQIIYLRKFGKIVTSLFFDKCDTFKIQYKLQAEFTQCNRKLEFLLANYKKLKGGE